MVTFDTDHSETLFASRMLINHTGDSGSLPSSSVSS